MGCGLSKTIAGSVRSSPKLFFLNPYRCRSSGGRWRFIWCTACLKKKSASPFFPLLLPLFFSSPQFGALCWHLNSCAVSVNVPLQSGSTVHPLRTSINYLAGFQTAAIRPTPSTLSGRCCFLLLSCSLNLKGHCNWKHIFILLYGKYNTTYFLPEKPEMLEQPFLSQNYCTSVSHPVWNLEFQKDIK